MSYKKIFITGVGIALYYVIYYVTFLTPNVTLEQPILKDRFGTTIWHTSDNGGEEHIYCYYGSHKFVLKRVNNFEECSDWFGTAILHEGEYASEKEKYYSQG